MSIDIVGYSALSELDEAAALQSVGMLRNALEGAALVHGGRIFNTAGDGFMLEFGSSLAAVEAAFHRIVESSKPGPSGATSR